jgi:lipopolysaccharide/colanic/teichoic acid biosynthesis glycosyltransferase
VAWIKRAYDVFFAALGLVVLAPFLLLLALIVKVSDGGPVLFKQQRMGQHGRLFRIWKYRTMVVNAEQQGLSLTAGGDPRITPVGRWLRRWKLDELPQLWNVLRGDMSLVGPRPEVPVYVDQYTEAQRQVLELKPGITDLATLEFRDEEELLREAPDPERFYVSHCIGRKIELNLRYARTATLWEDTKIILRTLFPALPLRSRATGSRSGAPGPDSSHQDEAQ